MKEGVKILVAYDGSSYAKKAVNEAADIAKRFSGSLTVLHVYWDPTRAQRFDGTEVRDQVSQQLMDEVDKSLKAAKVRYELVSERSEHPPNVILGMAKDGGYDCIALGSRGIGGARAWLLGSVSSKVVAEAECTVLVTK